MNRLITKRVHNRLQLRGITTLARIILFSRENYGWYPPSTLISMAVALKPYEPNEQTVYQNVRK